MKINLITCPGGVVLHSEINAYTVSELKEHTFDGQPHKVWGQCKIKDFPNGSEKVSLVDADLVVVDLSKRSNFINLYEIKPDVFPELITVFEKITGNDLSSGFYVTSEKDVVSSLKVIKLHIWDVLGEAVGIGEPSSQMKKFNEIFDWNETKYIPMVYIPTNAYVITEDKIKPSLKNKGELIDTIEQVVGVIKLITSNKENAILAKNMLANVEYNKYLDIIPIVLQTYAPNNINKLVCLNTDNPDFSDFIGKRRGTWRWVFKNGYQMKYSSWGYPHDYCWSRNEKTEFYPEIYRTAMEEFTQLTPDEIDNAYELILQEIPENFTNYLFNDRDIH